LEVHPHGLDPPDLLGRRSNRLHEVARILGPKEEREPHLPRIVDLEIRDLTTTHDIRTSPGMNDPGQGLNH
jgi:hypothetical protein